MNLVAVWVLERGNQARRSLHVPSLLLKRHTPGIPQSAGRVRQECGTPCRQRRHLTPTRSSPSEPCSPERTFLAAHGHGSLLTSCSGPTYTLACGRQGLDFPCSLSKDAYGGDDDDADEDDDMLM